MIVHYQFALDCPFCTAFRESGAEDLYHRTIEPIPDVRWEPTDIRAVGRSYYEVNEGHFDSKRLYLGGHRRSQKYVDEVYTPQLVLESNGEFEEFHPFERALDHDDLSSEEQIAQVHDSPRSVVRNLMKATFRFYLNHDVPVGPQAAMSLRQRETPGVAYRLEPAYEWDSVEQDVIHRIFGETVTDDEGHVIEKLGWYDAFVHAKQDAIRT